MFPNRDGGEEIVDQFAQRQCLRAQRGRGGGISVFPCEQRSADLVRQGERPAGRGSERGTSAIASVGVSMPRQYFVLTKSRQSVGGGVGTTALHRTGRRTGLSAVMTSRI